MKSALLLFVAVVMLAIVSPANATFWNHCDNEEQSWEWPDIEWCDWERPEPRLRRGDGDRPKRDWSNWEDCDWPVIEWPNDEECDYPKFGDLLGNLINGDKDWPDCDWEPREWCKPRPCDNPVPEPATAGLSLMGLAALAGTIRRRRK